MIPVPDNMLIDYDLDNESETDYKDLVLKEKRFISRNEEIIMAYAGQLYKEKTNGVLSRGYLNNTFDFKMFESYVTQNYLSKSTNNA